MLYRECSTNARNAPTGPSLVPKQDALRAVTAAGGAVLAGDEAAGAVLNDNLLFC